MGIIAHFSLLPSLTGAVGYYVSKAEFADIVLCVILCGTGQNFSEVVLPMIMEGSVIASSNSTALTKNRV